MPTIFEGSRVAGVCQRIFYVYNVRRPNVVCGEADTTSNAELNDFGYASFEVRYISSSAG